MTIAQALQGHWELTRASAWSVTRSRPRAGSRQQQLEGVLAGEDLQRLFVVGDDARPICLICSRSFSVGRIRSSPPGSSATSAEEPGV